MDDIEKKDSVDVNGVKFHAAPEEGKCAIWLTSGNKGGVGKSLLSILIADYLWRTGHDPIIGDSEKADMQRTFLNTMSRDGMIDRKSTRVWSFGKDVDFEKFLDDLQADGMRGKRVVVDTGANLLPELLEQIDFLKDVLGEGKVDFRVTFVCGPSGESAEALRDYIIAAEGDQIKTTVVTVAPDEIELEDYALMSDKYSPLRALLKDMGIPIVHIGRVPERFFAMVMRDPGLPPAQLADKMTGVGRRRLERWIEHDLNSAMSKITGIAEA